MDAEAPFDGGCTGKSPGILRVVAIDPRALPALPVQLVSSFTSEYRPVPQPE